MLTCGSLFSGIGGFCFGFESQGFTTSWAVEIDPAVRETYKKNFPETEVVASNGGDITKLNDGSADLSPVDVLHAGFPCQSFSQAGGRKGFDDPRGQLFFEITRLIDQWGEDKPKVLVLENAPFLLSGNGGKWFDTIRKSIQQSGYWFSRNNCYELDTYEWTDLPQRRARLFMVAVSRDYFPHNDVQFKKPKQKEKDLRKFLLEEGKAGDEYFLPQDNRYNEMIMQYVVNGDDPRLYQLRKYVVRPQAPNVCPTLTANMGRGGHNVPFVIDGGRLRKLTPRECLNLQGFLKSFRWEKSVSRTKRYEMIGNAVSPKISRIVAKGVRVAFEDLN